MSAVRRQNRECEMLKNPKRKSERFLGAAFFGKERAVGSNPTRGIPFYLRA